MSKMFADKKAFTVLEYSVLVLVVAAGLLLSFNYLERSFQARFKRNADVFSDRQYEPGNTRIVAR